ncbi:poly [ADP-ribose] polymerase 2-like [Amphibalanus amphitrite]|uniref:poly [ADP-ribose] polymerase 2-like n=1 Tax=Amphibalanus amphitrite TaxID=1232801 RepID=UPI001C900429|nr:poly [ADP-ribose] polymerase 2-like [Amphibalanus amphitrite]XP_043195198.1 poly [ADP-ribose] polymerase 2-like [Amphibalanus amphitrite]
MSFLFEVEHGRQWFQYDDTVQTYLQEGPQDGGTTVALKLNDTDVTVNFEEMTQASSAAKKPTRIRCVKTGGTGSFSWSIKEGKKETYLPMSIIELLEDALAKKKAKFVRQGVTYDLKNMARKKKGDVDMELVRVTCSGKAYDAKHKPVAGLKPADAAGDAQNGAGNAKNDAGNAKDAGDTAKKDAPAKKGSKRKNAAAAAADADADAGPQMKSVVLKGRAPVDTECPVAAANHVYCEGDDVWDCMLNQTNIGNNNNKYYLIQLLEKDGSGSYSVWMRWGRVGFKGQNSLTTYGANLEAAKRVFASKFQDKTKNAWRNRADFVKVPGKYDLLKMDYAEDEPDAKKLKTEAEKKKKKEIAPCSLEKKVQDLIELICNVKAMEEAVMEMQYDAKKAPLGKLTEDQIKAGYEALKEIDELIKANKTGRELVDACSAFYTRIPHCFGMRPPTIIRTAHEVKLKLELLEALGDIQTALKLIGEEEESGDGKARHPADSQYHALNVDIKHLSPSDQVYKTLEKYLETTHGHTHMGYGLKLLDAFSVTKRSEEERFVDHGNRMLLWHGSRLTNWAGIFGAGLKIAPPEAPCTGYMFGKGIYFADMASKSANYCCASRSKNEGILLLCEVSLGKPNQLYNANYNADKLPKGKHCTKGMGTVAPPTTNYVTLDDGVVVPMGPAKDTPDKNKACLMYNEYIVYDVAQVRMRYALRVKFAFK